MAEKEERITIHQVLYPCEKCSINCNKNDWKDCDFYQNYISGMTRQDAIECMAEAIYEFCRAHKPKGYLWYPRNNKVKDTYRACAEAALNALLEREKIKVE